MDIGNAQSALQTLTSSINTLNSALSGLLSNNGLKSISQDVQNLLESEVNTEVNSLLSEWEGSAAQTFMEDLKKRIDEATQKLKKLEI